MASWERWQRIEAKQFVGGDLRGCCAFPLAGCSVPPPHCGPCQEPALGRGQGTLRNWEPGLVAVVAGKQ